MNTDHRSTTGTRERLSHDTASASPQAEQLQVRIEQTRADMTDTVGALKEKLSPENLTAQAKEKAEEAKEYIRDEVRGSVQEAKDAVREATVGKVNHMMHDARDEVTEAGSTLLAFVRANPVPVALTGLGLTWLAASIRQSSRSRSSGSPDYARSTTSGGYSGYVGARSYDYGRPAEDGLLHKGQEAISGALHDVHESASHTADEIRGKMSGIGEQGKAAVQRYARDARAGMQRAEGQIERAMRENPLGLGAVALATGAAIGLALPTTRREGEWMGEARDSLVEKAEQFAHQGIDKVQDAAKELISGS